MPLPEARTETASTAGRLPALDLLRGLVMVVMALDHTRDYFHNVWIDPTDLSQTTPALFITRWITHFCAPVFVFLAGTGAFLYGSRGRTRGELSRFLLTRGLWLVFLELTIVHFSWTFDPDFGHARLLVIWALGVSMIVLSLLVYLPLSVITVIGLLMIATHNLLDPIEAHPSGPPSVLWSMLHHPHRFAFGDDWGIGIRYPLIPWIGVMAAGYGFGSIMLLPREKRRRSVAWLGLGVCAAFVILRGINAYGDPEPWSYQSEGLTLVDTFDGALDLSTPKPLFTFFSFVNCEKYPPSLDYLLMTIGPALLFLALMDRELSPRWRPILTFGRVPLFFYLLHIPLIHAAAIAVHVIRHGGAVALPTSDGPPQDWGFGLPVVYVAWIAILVVLYFPCRWFAGVKARRRDAWLSYL